MVSPTISLGSLGGGSSFMPPRRRRSASEMLEQLKRRRRESMAREGATAAEELTEARDVPIPLASAGVPRPELQSTRPPNIGEFIRLTSTLKMPERQLIHRTKRRFFQRPIPGNKSSNDPDQG